MKLLRKKNLPFLGFIGAQFPWPFLSALSKKFQRDNAFFLARGLAFDVLVCLIPAVFLLFILFGFLFDSPKETIQYMTTYMKSMIPFSRQQVLHSLFSVVKAEKILGLLGIIGLIWTLSRVFGSIRTVLLGYFLPWFSGSITPVLSLSSVQRWGGFGRTGRLKEEAEYYLKEPLEIQAFLRRFMETSIMFH